MKSALHLVLLICFSLVLSASANAQKDRFAYAVTDLTKEGASWNALRKLDLQTGEYSPVLLNGVESKVIVYDAVTKEPVTITADVKHGNMLYAPFATGVAAMALDKKNSRLYYTPMYIDQLRYIDLKTMKVYYVTNQPFTKHGNMHNDGGKIITRMVIAPDGNGYAISNDGKTFIQFTTGKKLKIAQLGALVDDPANNGLSIHNSCSSYGGDMVADDKGNLFILSANNQVFKVNTSTKIAKHLGSVKGLPSGFTINGAVVDAGGSLLVSSAVYANAYYVINSKDWSALPFQTSTGVYKSSDLANSNYFSTASPNKTTEIATILRPEPKSNHHIQVYPNPVTENQFTIQFNKVPSGDYTIEVTDVLGRRVVRKQVTVVAEDQTQQIPLSSSNAKGVYLVKVVDRAKKSFFEQKVMVQ